MNYITGDCHGNFERFNASIFPEQKEMTKDDYVIICGDFGGVWNKDEESNTETMLLDWLECKPFTTLFVDGNHENFDRLYEYPVEEWNGGKVHKIRPSVFHLMRGQVFELEGKKIFTFGGARSHDIDGGILEPDDPDFKKKKKELDKGWKNLMKHQNTVDFIVSHCASSSATTVLGQGSYKTDYLTDYLEEIRQKVTFKKWFYRHYHKNRNVNVEEILLWEQIIRIS